MLGRLVGKSPTNIVRTLDAVSYRESVGKHIVQCAKLSEPLVVTYPFPQNFPTHFRRSKAFDVRYFYTLRDVNVSPLCGLAWTPEGDLLLESVGSFFRILAPDYEAEMLLPVKSLPGDEPVFAFHQSVGYYHWVFEILPRFLHVRALVPEAKFLVPREAPKFFTEALELLLSPEEVRSKILVHDQPVRLSRFLLLTHERFTGFTHPDDLNKLRSSILPLVNSNESFGNTKRHQGNLIYVSRRKAPARSLLNEKELEDALCGLGFEIVYCEDMAWAEQIALFSGARLIVAPHGAGLSNIIWADKRCAVLEIFPHRMFVDCYAALAMHLELTYDYVECDFDRTSSGKIVIDGVLAKIDSLSCGLYQRKSRAAN